MKKIVVEIDKNWVLEHRNDHWLPMEQMKIMLAPHKLSVEEVTLTSMSIPVTADEPTADEIAAIVRKAFHRSYPKADVEQVLRVRLDEIDDEPRPDGSEAPAVTINRYNGPYYPDEQDADEDHDDAVDEVVDSMVWLVGAEEFRKLIYEIVRIAPQLVREHTQSVFFGRSYIFSVSDGCGLSTYLDYLARTLSVTKLCRMASKPVTEVKLGAFEQSEKPFESVMGTLQHGGTEGTVRILCVDISEWLGKTDNYHFKNFLRAVEKASDKFVVVFRVPFLEKDVLANLNHSLSDLLTVTTVSIPPFSQSNLRDYAEREFDSYGFTVVKGAWDLFFTRITMEKSDGKFYGLNTVNKVVREMVYYKQLGNAYKLAAGLGQRNVSHKIGVKDMRAMCPHESSQSGMEQLNKLVGNEQVKQKINEVIAQIELAAGMDDSERPCIHMRFVGNPGTGKTTVARILGKILKDKGLLRVGNFYEYAGRDLCGRYIGETAPKTSGICRDAYGSVLFIDEAYSLYRGDDNGRDYGREAIDTLIAEMENHRNDFVVIMAGYTDDMNKLMRGNQGLASRMPYTIEFPNFTREQLYEIFVSMVKERFKYDDKLFDAAREYFLSLPDETINAKSFSNARFVRNLFERTCAKAALRSQLANDDNVVLTKIDFDRASSEKDFAFNVGKKSRIGF